MRDIICLEVIVIILNAVERRDLGRRIKEARKRKNLSQDELANLIGYKVGTISKYEQGNRMPDIGTLQKIATVLECEIGEFTRASQTIREVLEHQDGHAYFLQWLNAYGIVIEHRIGEAGTTNTIAKVDGEDIIYDISHLPINGVMEVCKETVKNMVLNLGEEWLED